MLYIVVKMRSGLVITLRSIANLGETGMLKLVPGQNRLLYGTTLRPSLVETGRRNGSWTHAVSEEENDILSYVGVQLLSLKPTS